MQTQTEPEYLRDDVWYVAHLNAPIPEDEDGDFGRLETSIQDAYRLMIAGIEVSYPAPEPHHAGSARSSP